MHLALLQTLGMSKNEAQVYAALLAQGESSVAELVVHSGVYHRNVYDTLHRLLEKGLVLEIVQSRENHYQAVDPQKLVEVLEEERQILNAALPGMRTLFEEPRPADETVVYRGVEGWKSMLRDVLRVGENLNILGAKPFWQYPELRGFIPDFLRAAQESAISIRLLLDSSIASTNDSFLTHKQVKYKVLADQYSTPASAHVFGDYVTLVSNLETHQASSESSFTVLLNHRLALSYTAWFEMIWTGTARPEE